MRIYLIEEHSPRLRHTLQSQFREHGFVCDVYTAPEQGVRYITNNSVEYGCIVLRLAPQRSIRMCRKLRAKNVMFPIVVVCKKTHGRTRAQILDAGADDCISEPYIFPELVARVHAVLRRPEQVQSPRLQYADLVVNPAEQQVVLNGSPLPLHLTQFEILRYLIRHAEQVVTRHQLFENVWGQITIAESNVIDVHVHYLRKKLAAHNSGVVIKTVHGIGYQLTRANTM